MGMTSAHPLSSTRGYVPTKAVHTDIALFEKCRQYTHADEVKAAGLYPYFKPISESEDTVRRHRRPEADHAGVEQLPRPDPSSQGARSRHAGAGTATAPGCTGSRFLNGTLDLHLQLEAALAEFLGKEDCIVFSTGYKANLGLISGLIGRERRGLSSTSWIMRRS